MASVGIALEENVPDFLRAFQVHLRRELGRERSALERFAPLFFIELARAFRRNRLADRPWSRATLLIAARPEGGAPGLIREFSLLRQALWETMAYRQHAVAIQDRRAIDRAMDEALAEAVERNGRLEILTARATHSPFSEIGPRPAAVESLPGRGRLPPPLPTTLQKNEVRRTPPPLPTSMNSEKR
ncbi:MAG: hypothetical protein LBM75_04150 [Myxococcales bacterium]|jgi:hypothetical protein|nr:hypothetical protein [Myxococcales bacterium]